MVTAWPLTQEAGGVGTVVRVLSAELSKDSRVAALVCDWDAKHLQCSRVRQLTCYGLRLRLPYDPSSPVLSFLGWLRDLPMTLVYLRRLMRAERVDVVHLHFASAYQFYFRIMRALGGPPYVVTLHRGDTVNFPEWSKLEQALTLWMLRGAKNVNAVSSWLAELAARTFPGIRGVNCIHNGLKLSDFGGLDGPAPDAVPEVELPDKFFLMVSNVTYYKAPDVAIEAWARVQSRQPNLHLVIVGEARELWDTCTKMIEDLGCGDRVHMVGPMPRDTVLGMMKRAVALVFPSRNEGLGLVMLEAGAMGLPVICSRIGPLLEIAQDEVSALMVPPEEPEALADAVERLAGDSALRQRLGQALQERVRRDFSAESMATQYLAVYRDAIAADHPDAT